MNSAVYLILIMATKKIEGEKLDIKIVPGIKLSYICRMFHSNWPEYYWFLLGSSNAFVRDEEN